MCHIISRVVLVMVATAWGCSKPTEPTAPTDASQPAVTFHRDVAPILFDRCAGCHHDGGAAPFSLLTYNDARDRATQIADVTASRFMPPWLPSEGHEPFARSRRLDDREIQVFTDWVATGAVEGGAAGPPPPTFASDWQLGEPDVIVESPTFLLPADGPNRFRNFVLRVPAGTDRWIRAVEIRPEIPQATHHVRLGIDTQNESVRRDLADAGVGYEGMAWGQDPPGQLITWTPGMTPDSGTPGAAWRLTGDDALVLHTHLMPTGKPEAVRFRIGFHFAPSPPTVQPLILRIGSRDIDVPANEPRHIVRDVYELPVDVDVHFVFPHAHSLCREIFVQARIPDAAARTLIAIDRFDENSHDTYRFARPLRLPRGTKLATQFTYDNTSANIRNPHNPPQRVVYGSNSDDEMGDVYLQVIPVDPAEHAVLAEHFREFELNSKVVGYRRTLARYPDDPWSVEGLASCYASGGDAQAAVKLLESHPELLKSSVQANVILGMGQLAQAELEAAQLTFQHALEIDAKYAPARLGLGQAQVASGEQAAAEASLRRAIELAPRMTVAQLDLVDLLASQLRTDEALAICRAAIDASPTDHKPRLKLANLLAKQREYDAALEQFAAARESAPYVYRPEASLAIACYQFGDEQKAGELLRTALAANETDPVPHCFLGQIARRNEQWPAAREHLQRAAELPAPRSWPASHRRQFFSLVFAEQLQLAEQLQDERLAQQVLSKWIDLDPQNARLPQLLEQLQTGQSQ